MYLPQGFIMFIICTLEGVIAIFSSERTVQGEAACLHAANICVWVGMRFPLILKVGTESRRIIRFTPRPHYPLWKSLRYPQKSKLNVPLGSLVYME